MSDSVSRFATLDVASALDLLEDPEVVFVDVREDGELARTGWIPDAVHAPMSLLPRLLDPGDALHEPVLVSGKRLLIYCASGVRSVSVAETLAGVGIPHLAHLAGGIKAWLVAGGPTARER